ncbi:uncharacterized protein LOC144111129 [Amblyomma americanum]
MPRNRGAQFRPQTMLLPITRETSLRSGDGARPVERSRRRPDTIAVRWQNGSPRRRVCGNLWRPWRHVTRSGGRKTRRKCAMACPPGYGRRGKSCELCPASTYGRGLQCLPCPPNTYNLKAGSAYCRPCPPGAYVGTQCHPMGGALEMSLAGLVMKHGFITAASLSVLIACALFWLKTRKNSRSKAVPTWPLSSEELLPSSETRSGGGSSDALLSPEESSAGSSNACEDSSPNSEARGRTAEEEEEEEGSDDVVGAGGDASPRKRQLILKRLKEHGAVLPVAGVDINEISEKAKQFRARPSHM